MSGSVQTSDRRRLTLALSGVVATAAVIGAVGAQVDPAPEGQALFESHCAGCHAQAGERAPSVAQLGQMSPDQILGALHGIMAPMAADLSEPQKKAIAYAIGGKAKLPAPAVTGPTLGTTAAPIAGLKPAPQADWSAYKGNYASQNYSALDQINADTIKGLHVAWRQSLTPDAVRQATGAAEPTNNNETTPLMVGGLLYYSSGVGGVVALDPATGKVVWHVDGPLAAEAAGQGGPVSDRAGAGGGAARALAYWSDGKGDDRIIALVGNHWLTALNAHTGARYPDFGEGGQVDLRKGLEKGGESFAWLTGPNVIVRGTVVIGSAIADIADVKRPSKIDNPRGDVRGIDVRTGKQLWVWHAIPQAGEFGNDTWKDGSWRYTGGTNVWAPMSGDEELGLVYLPESSPSNDWYGGKRPGANLFSDSIVALDARTGRRVWYFQTVHHDIWDYDLPCAPVLADIVVGGRRIKALAQPSKQAFLYVLDRRTGKPVWPIEERPVPQGDAPSEAYSPTQPIPLDANGKPFAYDQQGSSDADLTDFTPALHAEAKTILDGYAHGGVYFPVVVDGKGLGAGKKGSLHMPSSSGGTNWPGAALDPATNMLYVPTVRAALAAKLGEPPAGSDTVLVREGSADRAAGPQGLPLFKPPYGQLVAIDLNKGEIKWGVANGDGPRNHPALKGMNLPQLGEPGRVGPLVTKSLIFMGEGMTQSPPGAGGRKFRAYDKATGRIVWEAALDGETTGVPMTYAWKGRQYVVVPIGGPGHPGEFVALALN